MCNRACIDFGKLVLKEDNVRGRSVIEVGSKDDNGSLRPYIESLGPASYIGVDIEKGPGVDMICGIEDLINVFGRNHFDLIVSTELLEHVRDWVCGIHNLKQVIKPGGAVLITARSLGCPYHGHPFDFWRYSEDDIRAIFSDMQIEELKTDFDMSGVFLYARKPQDFKETDASKHKLYSMLLRCRSSVDFCTLFWRIIFLPVYTILRLIYFCSRAETAKKLLKNNLKPETISRLRSFFSDRKREC